MANHSRNEEAEVEVICPRCDYRFTRTVGRLRRDTPVICPNCGYQMTNIGLWVAPRNILQYFIP